MKKLALMILSVAILICILPGCETVGSEFYISTAYSYDPYPYWTGTTYVYLNPNDYYYQVNGVIYHRHYHSDIIVREVPRNYFVVPHHIVINNDWRSHPPIRHNHLLPPPPPPRRHHSEFRSGAGSPVIPPQHNNRGWRGPSQDLRPKPIFRQTAPPQIRYNQPATRNNPSPPAIRNNSNSPMIRKNPNPPARPSVSPSAPVFRQPPQFRAPQSGGSGFRSGGSSQGRGFGGGNFKIFKR